MSTMFRRPKKERVAGESYTLHLLQRFALGGMLLLTIITFIAANLHAILWQSSQWLVSTVLPSVVVELTNDERSDLDEAPLRRSLVLDAAAKMKAEHMAKNQYFAHYAPDGTSPWYWFNQAGYTYAHAGENLAIHFTDSSEVVEAWMNSPTHRANIVSGKYTEIGVGTAKGTYEGYETVYVVQLFGAPAEAPVVKTTAAPIAVANAATEPILVEENEDVVLSETRSEPEQVEVTALEDDNKVVPTTSEAEIVVVPAPSTVEDTIITTQDDVVVVAKEMAATSSGLAVANIIESPQPENKTLFASIATKPNTILQIVYTLFGFIVIGLLLASVVLEARRSHYVQVAYGFALIAIMAGLWFIHALLTTGAVVA